MESMAGANGLIVIAESGSTKCDWIGLDRQQKEHFRFATMGFNPYFHSSDFIATTLQSEPKMRPWAEGVERLFFYGAGCSSPQLNAIVHSGLTEVFPNARIDVDHDVLSAAYSTYRGRPEITCILGTGSNSVYFDGQNLREEVPALAYILGDEGSASWLGKKLLAAYLYRSLPPALDRALRVDLQLTKEAIFESVYNKPNANVWLASFARLLGQYSTEPWVQDAVREGFRLFRDIHILCYPEARSVEVNFVGSVAWHFRDLLGSVLEEAQVQLGQVVARPLDGLVQYHFEQKRIVEQLEAGNPPR